MKFGAQILIRDDNKDLCTFVFFFFFLLCSYQALAITGIENLCKIMPLIDCYFSLNAR